MKLLMSLILIALALAFSYFIVKLAFSMHQFVGVVVFLFVFSRWTRIVYPAYRAAVQQESAREMGFY